MTNHGVNISKNGIEPQGVEGTKNQFWNLGTKRLYDEAIQRNEGRLTKDGPFVTSTGRHTGRSGSRKFRMLKTDFLISPA